MFIANHAKFYGFFIQTKTNKMKKTFFTLAFALFWVCLMVASCSTNPSPGNGEKQSSDSIATKSDSVPQATTSDGKVVVSEGDMEQASSDSVDK